MGSMKFNKKSILELQNKLQSKQLEPTTEEATKQWLIMPFIIALGYDPYSSDVIPEYTLDVGTKKGEKVDYALQINGQPVALIECKQLSTNLSDRHVSQLYRYFTISDVHTAILTNGDEYQFFTDSLKENVMDLKPYYTFKLSEATPSEVDKLIKYSKDQIQSTDVVEIVQHERFIAECKELAHGLKTNTIPTWILDVLSERSGLFKADKSVLADYLYTEIMNEFYQPTTKGAKYKKDIDTDKENKKSKEEKDKSEEKLEKSKSNIKLNHEYTYNDYSDGDWKFHTLDYAIILGVKYNQISGRAFLINTIDEILKQKRTTRKELIKEGAFDGYYKIMAEEQKYRGEYYLEQHDLWISTAYDFNGYVRFIEKLLSYAGIQDTEIKLSFKD